jgi:hypothetical protein
MGFKSPFVGGVAPMIEQAIDAVKLKRVSTHGIGERVYMHQDWLFKCFGC